jgi:transcriptional regulator GlxA family with amidase domain
MKLIVMEEETSCTGRSHSAGAMEGCGSAAILRIERCVDYMTQHLDKPLQVATLAAQANISPSHFFALFKRQIGSAPMDYFTRLRMRRARQLLECTSLSVKEIASALGYDDPFYFSRVFKSVNHVPPSGYRAAQREIAEKIMEEEENPILPREPKPNAIRIMRRVQFA